MTDPALNSPIQSAQTRQVYAASKVSMLTSTLLALLLAFIQTEVIDSTVVWSWLALVVLVALARTVLVSAYQHAVKREAADDSVWLTRFRWGVLAVGTVWGMAGFVLFPAHHPQYQVFLIFMLAGLTAGGVVSFAADRFSAILFCLLATVPLVVRLLLLGEQLSIAMALAILLYLAFMVFGLYRINQSIYENISLRLEACAREKAVRVSEERYRLLLRHSPVGIFHYDNHLVISYCNERFAEILHNTVERLTGLDMNLLKDQSVLPALRKPLTGEIGYYEGEYHATLSEADIWINMTCAPARDNSGRIIGGVAIVQDVTERRKVESSNQQQLAELAAVYRLSSAVGVATTLEEVYEISKQCILEVLKADRVSILLFDAEGVMRFRSWHGLSDEYRKLADGHSPWKQDALNPEPILLDDIELDADWAHFRPVARQEGIRAFGFIPLLAQGRLIGKFMIYYNQPHHFVESEIRLAKTIAMHIAFAIERNLARQEQDIAAITFEAQEGMFITDADVNIIRVNHAFSDITGYAAEEVIGRNPRLLGSGRQDKAFNDAMWESIRTTGRWKGEIYNRRKNGEIYPEFLTITAVKDAAGRVTNYISIFNDITASKAAEEQIRQLAYYDPLTNLPNRRTLMDRLKHALAASSRSGREGALLFIDLDNFKSLNDTLGHDIGDLLLQQVAQRLQECVREDDTVARLGGDEFVVLLEDLSEEPLEAAAQTETVGEKILAALNQPYQLAEHACHNSPSIGAILFSDHHQAIEDLMRHADIAMYQAKKAGRNALRFFDPAMQESINARAALERELRHALEGGQLQLHYQIQMDYMQRPLGAEALLRWQHPARGMVSPAQFIPLAEETGLILPIGGWVLETACAQLRAWQLSAPTRKLVLAVNVSARQFRQADFVEQVHTIMQRHAINPDCLKLELTESMLLEDIEETIARMNALKDLGVRFSLDDFGTGYSSLQYIKKLPLDQLKIDQSFVRDVGIDSSDRAIVRTIIAMAHSLKLDVIAEGVETEAQRQFLLNNGCLNFQGYLLGRPVPVEQFETMLKSIGRPEQSL